MYSAKKTVAVLPVLFSKHSVGAHFAYIWTLPAARYFLPVQPSGYHSGGGQCFYHQRLLCTFSGIRRLRSAILTAAAVE